MYDPAEKIRLAGRPLLSPPSTGAAGNLRLALDVVQQVLTEYVPELVWEPAELRAALAARQADVALEAERLFALGWLAWLDGDWTTAETHLAAAASLTEPYPQTAYWLARMRVLLGHDQPLSCFEGLLRKLAGSPQATTWYVDLLARSGRADRAEQVWKSIRGSKRMAGCPDAPLVEARYLLRKADLDGALALLQEARPGSGVLQVERHLLLAWMLAERGQGEQALQALAKAEAGPYPRAVLARWRQHIHQRWTGRLIERFRRRASTPGEFLAAVGAEFPGEPPDALRPYVHLAQLAAGAEVPGANLAPEMRRNLLRLTLAQIDDASLLAEGAADSTDDLAQACALKLWHLALHRGDRPLLTSCAGAIDPDALHEAQLLLDPDSSGEALCALLASGDAHARGCLQAVVLVEAIRSGNVEKVAAQLEQRDHWQGFEAGPPRFALAALVRMVQARSTHQAWPRALPAWLKLWPAEVLGEAGAMLASLAGLSAAVLEAPPGVDAAAWHAHQAARALLREQPEAARVHLQALPGNESLRAEVERLAAAQRLAEAVRHPHPPALADLVALLEQIPGGSEVLTAPPAAVTERLARLADRPGVPPRLLHHLALLEMRLAEQFAGRDPLLATLHARRAWLCWFGLFSSPETPPPEARGLLVEHLIGWHARCINDHLSRDESEAARSHWQLVGQLPALARPRVPDLVPDLETAGTRFRDGLATSYLLTVREAMRFGDIPEGWRADYPRGLALLQRLLAIDPDNVRLLTAHVETCHGWFFDLYQLGDERIYDEVERQTPRAVHLAELTGGEAGPVTTRAALAEFWKFRGFVARSRPEKVELYREALRLDPGNSNVRDLLAEMETSSS
ncbi:MAG: hypothetical protein U0840_17665 [Gemmataceae bacterium]